MVDPAAREGATTPTGIAARPGLDEPWTGFIRGQVASYGGGAPERAPAERLRVGAAQLEVRWSRTAQVLRELADTYERDAERFDRDAERRSDEG